MLKKQENILLALFYLYFISFFFPFWNPSRVMAMALLMSYSFYLTSFAEKKLAIQTRKYIWFMIAFTALIIISVFLSSNQNEAWGSLRVRLPLVLFPISLGLLTITKEFRDKVLLGLTAIVIAGCLISLGWAIHQYVQTHDSSWLYNDALSYGVGQQSIYTSVLVNISIYVLTYRMLGPDSSKKKLLYLVGIVFLFIISYMLASRNMMIILYGTTILFLFYFVFKRKKYLEGAIITMLLIMGGFAILKFFPKTINRFKEMAYTKFDYTSRGIESHYGGVLTADQWNGANSRLALWSCGWQLFRQHPLCGVDIGDRKDELFKVYDERHFYFGMQTKKNVHNNYLDILFGMGLITLIIFLIGWIILPFLHLVNSKDGLALVILITFILAMLTENYFDRSLGGVIFGFFVPFLLISKQDKFP